VNPKIQRLLKQQAQAQQPFELLEAQRRYRLAKTLLAGRPQTGVYWWVPSKTGWELYPVLNEDNDPAYHQKAWGNLVRAEFPKSSPEVTRAYAGLPRGRVINWMGDWTIYHGGDTPEGPTGLRKIARAFSLPAGYNVQYSKEYRMLPQHYEALKKNLRYKSNLQAPPDPDTLDEEDEMDDLDYAEYVAGRIHPGHP